MPSMLPRTRVSVAPVDPSTPAARRDSSRAAGGDAPAVEIPSDTDGPRVTWKSVAAAAPDLALGVVFLVAWVAPSLLREHAVSLLVQLVLFEFIVIHSSAFMGGVITSNMGRPRKTAALLLLSGFYSVLIGGFAGMFRSLAPLVSFWGLSLNRILGVLIGQAPSGEERTFLRKNWAVSVSCYILFAGVTTLLPLPALGLTREVLASEHLPWSGLWADHPHKAVAFGFLYFLSVGLSELGGHAWIRLSPADPHGG